MEDVRFIKRFDPEKDLSPPADDESQDTLLARMERALSEGRYEEVYEEVLDICEEFFKEYAEFLKEFLKFSEGSFS